MRPLVDTVRISRQGRDHLIKIRRQTGLEHWNIICRWAVCASLREPTKPPAVREALDSGVEMTWKVFAGDQGDLFTALLTFRANHEGQADSQEALANSFKAHLHRGLSYLASGQDTKTIADFLERWLDHRPKGSGRSN